MRGWELCIMRVCDCFNQTAGINHMWTRAQRRALNRVADHARVHNQDAVLRSVQSLLSPCPSRYRVNPLAATVDLNEVTHG